MPAVVKSAMAQRDVTRRFELLSATKAEKERLAAAPPKLRNSAVGALIAKDIARAEAAASARITAILRARCDRFLTESRDELARSDQIDGAISAIRAGTSKCIVRK
jgi:hypothetical protein